jgi:hypothetical protein
MAKVYKVSFYITDYNDEYRDRKHLLPNLRAHLDELDTGIDFIELEESRAFEWDDELTINSTLAEKKDYEEYFKKDKD